MKKLHMIGNGHLDPVWLWRWQEGFSEIKATFKAALDRIEQFDDFIFTCAGGSYYQWVEENEPELFAQIQKRVTEGRWVLAGGWWIQPDCNLPSGESFARHGLYGQRYLYEKFGKYAEFGYNVDSFGHNGMLPQLLSKCGLKNYVMMRPDESEKAMNLNLFWWESLDGSKVLTYKIPCGYGGDWHEENLRKKYVDICNLAQKQDVPQMYFYGVGNHGGGPTINCVNILHDIQNEKSANDLVFSSPKEYFEEVRNDGYDLPVIKEDLQHHAAGCYSTVWQVKADNRRTENRLVACEKYDTVIKKIFNTKDNKKKIKKAWENVMFNQFHDIMGGCSIREAYDDAAEGYGESLKISGDILNFALQKISWNIDTMKEHDFYTTKEFNWSIWEHAVGGAPVVVFNTLAWEVEKSINLTHKVSAVTDDDGVSYPFQIVRASRTNGNDKYETTFSAKIPAFGYKVFYIFTKKEIEYKVSDNMLDATQNTIENAWYKLTIDTHTGYIKSLFNKETNTEVFAKEAAVPVVIDDYTSDTWGHAVTQYNNDIGKFSDAKVALVENGDVRATIKIISKYGNSQLHQDITIYRDIKDIDVKLKLNWQEEHKILKLSFPSNTKDNTATYEIPYGVIKKVCDGQEEPGQTWVNVTGTNPQGDKMGVSIVNTTKYSYNVIDNDLRMNIARSAIYADHYGQNHRDDFCEFMDQGIQRLSYSIVVNDGELKNIVPVKKGHEINNEPVAVYETYHKGTLKTADSFATVSNENVILSVLKQGEDDDDSVVVRLYEVNGEHQKANVTLPLFNANINLAFTPYEIKTVKITNGDAKEVDMLEM